jgi:hypothetical protein
VAQPLSAVLGLALEEPGKPDAAPSGAQSCADQALAVEPVALQVFELEPGYSNPDCVRQELAVRN